MMIKKVNQSFEENMMNPFHFLQLLDLLIQSKLMKVNL